MAVVLGAGDSFHLVPRAIALCTTGLESYTVPLGMGKWITSITMTVLGMSKIPIYKSFFLEVLKLLAFQGIWMFLCSQFPLFFPLPGKNKGKSYCTLSSSFAASRLASLLACA